MMWMNQVTSASETDSHPVSPPPAAAADAAAANNEQSAYVTSKHVQTASEDIRCPSPPLT